MHDTLARAYRGARAAAGAAMAAAPVTAGIGAPPVGAAGWATLAASACIPLLLVVPRLPTALRAPSNGGHVAATVVALAAAAAAAGWGLHASGVALVPASLGAVAPAAAVLGAGAVLALVALALAILRVQLAAPDGDGPVALPNVGFLMITYAVADWIIVRLFGAGLLALAWMVHGATDPARIAPVLHGLRPDTMTGIYATWGALLLLPFLLPRNVARPCTVVGGAVKVAIMIAAALALLPAVELVVATHVPRDYRAAIEDAVPNLLKGIVGIAVLSTMAVAFFRQLGASAASRSAPEPGNSGPTVEELRQMRLVRMQG